MGKARRYVEAINLCHKVLSMYPDYPTLLQSRTSGCSRRSSLLSDWKQLRRRLPLQFSCADISISTPFTFTTFALCWVYSDIGICNNLQFHNSCIYKIHTAPA